MSTQSKKKSIQKPATNAAAYKIAQKVYFINYRSMGPGKIIEGEVKSVKSEQFQDKDFLGKATGNTTSYSYVLDTRSGHFEISQFDLYPNYTEAAKTFAKEFFTPLK